MHVRTVKRKGLMKLFKKPYVEVSAALEEESDASFAKMRAAVNEVAKIKGLEEGFRVINNCRENGGQTVKHIHFHVIGGLKLTEKMI